MERADLQAFLEEGLSLEQIGRRVGKHPTTVSYWCKRHGLVPVNQARHAARGGIERATLEPLVEAGLSLREIGTALGVSLPTVRHWMRRHGLRTMKALPAGERPTRLVRVCRRHGRTDFVRNRAGHYRCARCRAEAVARRRRKVKELLVAEAGGRCVVCGYTGSAAALHFHHIDPSTKRFGLAAGGITLAIETVREEARKCVLLCANCHAEVEAGDRVLPGSTNGGPG